MGDFVQVTYTAVLLGAIYSLMGSGLTLVWGGLRFPNLAHGALLTLGGFVSYWLVVSNGLPAWMGLPVGLVLSAAAGTLIYLGLFRRLLEREDGFILAVVASLGVAIAFEAWFLIESPRSVQLPALIDGVVTLPGGIPATAEGFLIIGSSIVLLSLLSVFFARSPLGAQVRAVAENREGAELSGIWSGGLFVLVIAMSGGLAGLSGVMLGSVQFVSASGGWIALLMALIVTVVGGLGSFGGSIVAAYVVGLSQSAASFWLGSEWVLPILFAGLMLFLVARPQGIAGKLTFEPGQ